MVTGSSTRQEIALWQSFNGVASLNGYIGAYDLLSQGFGGWHLSVAHLYDPYGKVLYLGNGERRSATGMNFEIINTVAGNGLSGNTGDGGLATNARLDASDIDVGPDGSIYIVGNSRIRRVDPNGIITTVAGNGISGYSGDGGLATEARLSPHSVAVGKDGSLYIASYTTGDYRIRRVDPNGIITTVAGNGISGYSGDGGLATEARLSGVNSVAVGPDGSLYIAEFYRIRRVGTDGIITTFAGNGQVSHGGDGGPATEAAMNNIRGIAVGPDGSLYIAEMGGATV